MRCRELWPPRCSRSLPPCRSHVLLQRPDASDVPSEAELLSITQDLGLFAHLEQPQQPAQLCRVSPPAYLSQPTYPAPRSDWDLEGDELWLSIRQHSDMDSTCIFVPNP